MPADLNFSIENLFAHATMALARTDVDSLMQIASDCRSAELPASPEEFSRALVQQAAFERLLEETRRNIRLFERNEISLGCGRYRGRNA